MTANDILEALPNLTPAQRAQIFQELCQLLDEDLVRGFGPTPDEKRMLDAALADHARDGETGMPWHECLKQLKDKQQPIPNKQLTNDNDK